MRNFFAPEETGKRLQSIAKIIAVITIVTAVLGGILVLAGWAENQDSRYYDSAITWNALGTLFAALGAEIFACLLLHGFGVLVECSYQQKQEAKRQTALLNQLIIAQKISAAPVNTAPLAKAVPVANTAPVVKPAPAAAQPVVPVDTTVNEAVNILAGLLSVDGEENRWKYLQDKIDTAKSEQLRAVCRKAIGMSDEQIIELIGMLK